MTAPSQECVVCGKAAVLYCHQDDAHLCSACDQQVHSANPLASRHHRVPIAGKHEVKDEGQAVPEAVCSAFSADPAPAPAKEQSLRPEALAFDDDAFFAVPDVDMPSLAADDNAARVILGKSFASDEFDFGEIDPLWLDRLDVGLDRLPSDVLDSLVPEAPPAPKPAAKQPEPRALSPPPAPPAMHHHHHHAHPHHAPAHHHAHMQPYPHPALVPQYAPPAEACKWEAAAAPAEAPLDIDSYIPRSLLPVDPSTRVQLLRARREKLERFREKKRNRHFKKTIRYASRKAYAEVRPRIKGRFARKDEVAAMRAAGLLPAA